MRTAEGILKFAPDAKPMDILDEACDGWQGSDAEFDDDTNPDQIFGKLMTEAFNPEYREDEDDHGDVWWDTVYEPFKLRYKLT